MSDTNAPNDLPLDRAPLGLLAGRTLVNALIGKADNTVERYLERKSELDLTSKVGQAKLAKFILGAANRDPEEAARHFEGYGVMVIGFSSEGELIGANLPDPEQWEDGIRRFLGTDGPQWDIQEVSHPDSGHRVLILLVDPPRPGHPMFVCRATGEGVTDGQVYIRRRGKTEQADHGEMHMLLARGVTSEPTVELDVSLEGEAVPLSIDYEASFEEYLTQKREELLAALPQPEPESDPESEDSSGIFRTGISGLDPAGIQANVMADLSASIRSTYETPAESPYEATRRALGLTERPEPRSEQEYRDEIDEWTHDFRQKIPAAVGCMAAYVLDAVVVRVHNKSEVYLEDVSVIIHLEGDVRAIEWLEPEGGVPRRNYFDLPSPPRKWGPVKSSIVPHGMPHTVPRSMPGPIPFGSPTVSWNNGGSVTVEMSVDPLRPREMHTDDSGAFVLLLPTGFTEDVRGTWTVTARGHHKVYEGELVVPVGEELNLTGQFRKWLQLER